MIASTDIHDQGQTGSDNRREGARKEATMATNFEAEVREFAREFPTPNVQRAVALCEAGTLTWGQVYELFRRSLAKGLTEVAA